MFEFLKNLFGLSPSSPTPTGNPATDYKKALSYLDNCGPFNEEKLREANRIAGTMLSEGDIQMMLQQAQMIMPTASEPGGMEFIRGQLREQMETFIQISGTLGI